MGYRNHPNVVKVGKERDSLLLKTAVKDVICTHLGNTEQKLVYQCVVDKFPHINHVNSTFIKAMGLVVGDPFHFEFITVLNPSIGFYFIF
jgi:hypothetical protein